MTLACKSIALVDTVRFRDDDPELFGVTIGDGLCDETYARGLREHLSHSVELVPELFPDIARAVDEVRRELLPNEQIRAFISSDNDAQAYCIGGQQEHTMILGLTSGLVRLMSRDELKFVIGHELGHYLMGHHRRVPPEDDNVETINYRSLQRMAEISADRVGFLACPRGDAAYRAILKTASGLDEPHIRFDIRAFNGQLDKLKQVDSTGQNAWTTHPLLTVRCKALTLFQRSAPYFEVTGKRGRADMDRDTMESAIADDLAASTGYNPLAEMEKSVRRSLIWLVLRLFIEDGRFSKPEQAFLRDTFDQENANRAIEFTRQHGPVAVCNKYREALLELAQMNESARDSACAVVRRVASIASGDQAARLTLVKEMHEALECKQRARIEPWEDAHSLGGLIAL